MTVRCWVGLASVLALSACESDEAGTTDTHGGAEQTGADAQAGGSNEPDAGGSAETDAALQSDAAWSSDASDAMSNTDDDGVDRDVLRPPSRTPTDALIASLQLPPGFRIQVFARDMQHARMLAVHGEHVYLTRPNQGDVVRLTDRDGDGVSDEQRIVAADLPGVHGIAIRAPNVFLATPTSVYRATLASDGTLGSTVPIIDDLPAGGQHPNRTLLIGEDDKLYITLGSPCDACPIDNPEYATVLRADIDGSRREIFARGLRNTLGFDWHPETGALWGFDHGSDWRGDDIPPEELNLIEQDKDYGWPYCYGQRQIDPVIQQPVDTTKEAYCPGTTPPVLENQAHQAPIALHFYTGAQFPASYKNSAFVAFRGSWNRIPATGYKVARVVFEGGQPVRVEDFVTGFLIENGSAQFGRLAGIAEDASGSLLFTDDENGVIYRVRYAP